MKYLLSILLFFSFTAYSEPIAIFAHGIVDNSSQSQRFQTAIATKQTIAPNFADAISPSGLDLNNFLYTICSYFGKNVNRNAMFMGQKDDITLLQTTITSLSPDDKIILYGCSRGAAAAVTYLGIHNPENIAALILDACPANMPETIQMTLAKLGINPHYCNTIFSYLFPQYDSSSAITPLQALPKIENKNLPILLIHSLEDKSVHFTNSLKLYHAFIEAGFKNVHICLLPHGRHSFLLQDEHVTGMYTGTVHSFYKKYNLPYNQKIQTFDLTSNSLYIKDVKNQITEYEMNIWSTYQKTYNKNIYYSSAVIALAIAYWYIKNSSLQ